MGEGKQREMGGMREGGRWGCGGEGRDGKDRG